MLKIYYSQLKIVPFKEEVLEILSESKGTGK